MSRFKPLTIMIGGRATTVRLEPEYHLWLRQAAYEQNTTTKTLLAEIARTKSPQQSLSSAIRVNVTRYFRDHPSTQ
jgi:predicted DNA-binding ribbon-helix-helix protein